LTEKEIISILERQLQSVASDLKDAHILICQYQRSNAELNDMLIEQQSKILKLERRCAG